MLFKIHSKQFKGNRHEFFIFSYRSVKYKVLDLHSQNLKNIFWSLQSNSTEIKYLESPMKQAFYLTAYHNVYINLRHPEMSATKETDWHLSLERHVCNKCENETSKRFCHNTNHNNIISFIMGIIGIWINVCVLHTKL
jgi:hypothetical protein